MKPFILSTFLDVINKIKDYITNQGIASVVIEFLIFALILGLIIWFLYKYTNKKVVTFTIIFFVALFVIILLLNLTFLLHVYKYILIGYFFVWTLYYAPTIKNLLEGITKPKNVKNFVNNEEQQEALIDVLIKAVTNLSERHVGAIITIEREDSLNTYIQKGVSLDAEVTVELIETIFMPGTALHDGAVIIREDRIMSAATFYPTSETIKIASNYGSRHRAALGISEDTDAFTIVVSEETGHVSITKEGTLTQVTIEGLRSFLKENIIIK